MAFAVARSAIRMAKACLVLFTSALLGLVREVGSPDSLGSQPLALTMNGCGGLGFRLLTLSWLLVLGALCWLLIVIGLTQLPAFVELAA